MDFQGENRHGLEIAYMQSEAKSEEFQAIHSKTIKKHFRMLPCFHILEFCLPWSHIMTMRYGKMDVKTKFLNRNFMKGCVLDTTLRFLSIKKNRG